MKTKEDIVNQGEQVVRINHFLNYLDFSSKSLEERVKLNRIYIGLLLLISFINILIVIFDEEMIYNKVIMISIVVALGMTFIIDKIYSNRMEKIKKTLLNNISLEELILFENISGKQMLVIAEAYKESKDNINVVLRSEEIINIKII